MKILYTVGDLRKHFEDVRDDIMLVDGETGYSHLVVGEADIYIDTENGDEMLGIPVGGIDEGEYDGGGGSRPTLKIVK